MFNALCYGEAGSGKTPFAGTLEKCSKTSPCLFLDVDMGAMSLTAPMPTVLEIVAWNQMQSVYEFLKKCDWAGLATYLSKHKGVEVPVKEYKSIVIDSATELEYMCRQVVIQLASAIKDHDPEVPEQRDYLKTGERMKRLVRAFRDLPLCVVLVAGVRDLKDDRDGSLRHYPAFQPGLSKDLVRMTDLVMYMGVVVEKDKWLRTLQTALTQRIIARDRSGKLLPFMKQEKFDFGRDIISKMEAV